LNIKPEKIKIKAHALVRDKNGKPKIDNYATCPESIKAALTKQEKEEFENGTYSC